MSGKVGGSQEPDCAGQLAFCKQRKSHEITNLYGRVVAQIFIVPTKSVCLFFLSSNLWLEDFETTPSTLFNIKTFHKWEKNKNNSQTWIPTILLCTTGFLGQIKIWFNLEGFFYSANTGSYTYFQLNRKIFTFSDQQWWHWTQLLWATGSWIDAGRMGSSQCFLHLYQPGGGKGKMDFRFVTHLPPSRQKIGWWKKNEHFKNNQQCLLFNIVYHQHKNGVTAGFSLCQELKGATWSLSWGHL